MEATAAKIMGNLATVDHRINVLVNTQRSLTTVVYNMNKRDTARRKVSAAAHTIWSLMGANSWTPFRVASPSEANEPEDAAWWSAGSPHRRLEVDTVTAYTVRKTTGSGPDVYYGSANHELREDAYTVVCDAAQLMGRASPVWEAGDVLELLGPTDDCMPLDASPVGGVAAWVAAHVDVEGTSDWTARAAGRAPCQCWMEKASQTCDIVLADGEDRPLTRGTASVNGAGDPISVPSDAKHLSKAGLAGISAGSYDPCGSETPAAVTLSDAEALITSYAEYAAEVKEQCFATDGRDYSGLEPSAFSKAADDAVDALPLGVAYLTSARLSAMLADNTYAYVIGTGFANASYCGPDAESREAAGGALLPSALWSKFLSDAWGPAYRELRATDIRRYGMLEADTNIEELPFVFDDTTLESFPCWRVSSVATQGKMERVASLEPGPVQKFAEVWMAPVAPSEEGASDGRVAVHVQQSDPEISADQQHLLAKISGYKFVGDPWCMFVDCPRPEVGFYAAGTDEEVRYLYDLPASLTSLAGEAGLRAGTATYLLSKDTSQAEGVYTAEEPGYAFTLTEWEDAHPGEIFDPKAAGADIAGFFRELVETPGGHGPGDVTCAGGVDPAAGPLCSLLNHFYFLVHDIVVDGESVTGAHAYLHGTPAAQCADRSTGAFCLVPRDWQAESQVTIPVGEVTATLGASCPMLDTQLLSFTGLPTVSVTNTGALSTAWYWDLEFRGPNATLDSAFVTDLYESLPPGSAHPCASMGLSNQDGGTLAARSAAAMPSSIHAPLAMCAQWTVTLSIIDPRTLLRKPCLVQNITKSIGEGVTTTLNVPEITFDDSATAEQVNTIVVPTTASMTLDASIALAYVLNNMPGGKPAFDAYTAAIPGYAPSVALANISTTLSAFGAEIGDNAAAQSAAAQAAIAATNADAGAYASAATASQADVATAQATLEAGVDAVAAAVVAMDAKLAVFNASMALLRNATDTFVGTVRTLNNITTAYAAQVDHWGAQINDVANDVANAVGDAASAAYDFVADNIPTGLSGVGGFFGSVVDFLIQAAIICLIVGLLYFAWQRGWLTSCCKKGATKAAAPEASKGLGGTGTKMGGATTARPPGRRARYPPGPPYSKVDVDEGV